MNDEPNLQPTEQPAPPSGPSGFVRFIVVLLVLVAIGGFGCVTLCGAAFTLGSLGGVLAKSGRPDTARRDDHRRHEG